MEFREGAFYFQTLQQNPKNKDILEFLRYEQFFIREMSIIKFKETEGLALQTAVISVISDSLENIIENLNYEGDYVEYMMTPFYELYKFQLAYDRLRSKKSKCYNIQQVFLFVDEIRSFLQN